VLGIDLRRLRLDSAQTLSGAQKQAVVIARRRSVLRQRGGLDMIAKTLALRWTKGRNHGLGESDVAGAIISLASDAGRMVIGTILVGNGGRTLQ
jgi:hypothetical protein